ncbi:cob(I)yrinic acid a,c-diamide adenosyltransferase [Magnetovibrio sp. PR-2]|uniref:cob(I)yrinic acid a,c-diamide adenosyltransferase n=1 Tax=Magnetovibrio sp. PR-2 TaxID=3120356 RepID=UPI002FCE5AB8
MVKLSKIYTRGGDGGTSGLVDGSRASKSHLRFDAIGDVDEVNCAIGMARVVLNDGSDADRFLAGVQNDLFDLGADLATPGEIEGALRLAEGRTCALEAEIDVLSDTLGELTSFVLPGGSEAAARLHVARALTRRAERTIVKLNVDTPLNPEILKYINRLSDFLFQLARAENDQGAADVLWKPGGDR